MSINPPRIPSYRFKLTIIFFALLPNFSFLPELTSSALADFEAGVGAYVLGDYETALAEFLPEAKAGDGHAQTYLGDMYRKGLGIEQNYLEAAKWYRLAADQGE